MALLRPASCSARSPGWTAAVAALTCGAAALAQEEAGPLPEPVAVVTRAQLLARGATNLAEALRGLPGVDVLLVSASQPIVGMRGGDPYQSNHVALFLDGAPLAVDFLSLTPWGQLPVSLAEVERIEVMRGPGLFFGTSALAGAVNVVTRRPGEGHLAARLAAGELAFRGYDVGGGGPFSEGGAQLGVAGARVHEWGGTKALVDSHDEVSGRVAQRLGTHALELTAGVQRFAGSLRLPDRLSDQGVTTHNLSLSVADRIALGDAPRAPALSLRLGFADQAFALTEAAPSRPVHSVTRDTWTARADFTAQLPWRASRVTVGADAAYTRTQSLRFLERERRADTGGVFGSWAFRLADLSVAAGARLELGLDRDLHPTATLAAALPLGPGSALRLSLASAARAPDLDQLGLLLPVVGGSKNTRVYLAGNPALTEERQSQAELAYRWESPRLSAGASLFASQLGNAIEPVEITPARVAERQLAAKVAASTGSGLDPSVPFVEFQNQGRLRTLGAEISGELRAFPSLTFLGSYTRLHSAVAVISAPETVLRRQSALDRAAPANRFSLGLRFVWQGRRLHGQSASLFYDWSGATAAEVAGRIRTVPSWSTLTARLTFPILERGELGVEVYNLAHVSHLEWPRGSVVRRLLAVLRLEL